MGWKLAIALLFSLALVGCASTGKKPESPEEKVFSKLSEDYAWLDVEYTETIVHRHRLRVTPLDWQVRIFFPLDDQFEIHAKLKDLDWLTTVQGAIDRVLDDEDPESLYELKERVRIETRLLNHLRKQVSEHRATHVRFHPSDIR